MQLEAFNLLVGVSGAGKTRIIRSLERVYSVALGKTEADAPWSSHWALTFEHEGLSYRWEAETEAPPPLDGSPGVSSGVSDEALIRHERITQGDEVLLERTSEKFAFQERLLPRLDRARSAIALLKEDQPLAALHQAFSRMVYEHRLKTPSHGISFESSFDEQRHRYRTVEELGADFALPFHHKAELLQGLFPSEFHELQERFREAFPTIEQIQVIRTHPPGVEPGSLGGAYQMLLCAREAGVSQVIPFAGMSSGMQRFLVILVYLAFAPRGTVVLIDELEASMGINCLPAVTQFLLSRAPDLQFILTSHHPYIIEQIPSERWKIVTRQGSHVRVLDAASIPALKERSHLDRFTRLMNLSEYEHGVQP
jgi:hypothetical protein